jgi:HrpA-like RNA helicase
VGAVVLDEAHERSVKSDLILGALKSLPGLQHLKVIVASATMDTALFSAFLGGAPVVDVPGRVFPVDVVYRPSERDPDTVSKVVAMALEIHAGPPASGDVLAFLTGQADVLRACAMFSRAAKEGSALTLPLYGKPCTLHSNPETQHLELQAI